ncbi:MAG: monovalent cation/H(+) antiporter subunit G [Pseudomonadota bacterium]
MVEQVLTIVSITCLLTGGVFGIIGGIGLLRFPDVYSRLHAASITDTLCALLIVLGLLIQVGLALPSIKLLLVLLFLLFTAPTASHALARAAVLDGVEPALAKPDTVHTSSTESATASEPGAASSNT